MICLGYGQIFLSKVYWSWLTGFIDYFTAAFKELDYFSNESAVKFDGITKLIALWFYSTTG